MALQLRIDLYMKDDERTIGGANIVLRWGVAPKGTQWYILRPDHMSQYICHTGESGFFQLKASNGVMWLWDSARIYLPASAGWATGEKVCMILWDAPWHEFDSSRKSGGGRVYEARNVEGTLLRLKWSYHSNSEI